MADKLPATNQPQDTDGLFGFAWRILAAVNAIGTNVAAAVASLATGPTPATETAWLASAVRTTTQAINLTVPAGAVGIMARLYVTAVPGVDTVSITIADQLTGRGMVTGGAQVAAANCFLLVKTGGGTVGVPLPASSSPVGLPEKITLNITHSAASNFTYSATYCWLYK